MTCKGLIAAALILWLSFLVVERPARASSTHTYIDFAEALALLTKNQKPKAYHILERVFEQSSSSDADRKNAALILAYADTRSLQRQKRHFYAQYMTGQLPDGALRSALLRIAGDGFFEGVDLVAARKAYEQLTQSQSPSEQDYGHYKLGWIDLNQKEPAKAFSRWFSLINSGKTRAQDLRSSLIHDLGRAWAETVPVSSEQTSLVRDLDLDSKERAEFKDGTAAGMRRLQETTELPQFREQLRQTQYLNPMLPEILSQGVGMAHTPCSVMDWFDDSVKIKDIDSSLLVPRLNSCYLHLSKTHKSDWKTQPEARRLLGFYEHIELSGLKRWPRASFFKESESYVDACAEFVSMAREETERGNSDAITKTADGIQNLVESCRKAATGPPEILARKPELGRSYIELLQLFAAKGLLGAKEENPLYGVAAYFVKMASFRKELLDVLLKNPPLFKQTLLPSLITEMLDSTEKTEHGDELLKAYAPRPITAEDKVNLVWIELLRQRVSAEVDAKRFAPAAELLKTYIPLTAIKVAGDRRPSIWYLWALALDVGADESLRSTAREVTAFALKTLQGDLAPTVLGLSLKYDMVLAAWEKWPVLRHGPQTLAPLMTNYLQKMFSIAESGAIDRTALIKNEDGLKIATALRFENPVSFDQIPNPPFVEDLRVILELKAKQRELAHAKFKFNSKLPKLIDSRIAALQSEVDGIKKKIWSHVVFGKKARAVLAATCEGLAGGIDAIAYPSAAGEEQIKQWREQLGQISTTVRGWQKSLLADGGA